MTCSDMAKRKRIKATSTTSHQSCAWPPNSQPAPFSTGLYFRRSVISMCQHSSYSRSQNVGTLQSSDTKPPERSKEAYSSWFHIPNFWLPAHGKHVHPTRTRPAAFTGMMWMGLCVPGCLRNVATSYVHQIPRSCTAQRHYYYSTGLQ